MVMQDIAKKQDWLPAAAGPGSDQAMASYVKRGKTDPPETIAWRSRRAIAQRLLEVSRPFQSLHLFTRPCQVAGEWKQRIQNAATISSLRKAQYLEAH